MHGGGEELGAGGFGLGEFGFAVIALGRQLIYLATVMQILLCVTNRPQFANTSREGCINSIESGFDQLDLMIR